MQMICDYFMHVANKSWYWPKYVLYSVESCYRLIDKNCSWPRELWFLVLLPKWNLSTRDKIMWAALQGPPLPSHDELPLAPTPLQTHTTSCIHMPCTSKCMSVNHLGNVFTPPSLKPNIPSMSPSKSLAFHTWLSPISLLIQQRREEGVGLSRQGHTHSHSTSRCLVSLMCSVCTAVMWLSCDWHTWL